MHAVSALHAMIPDLRPNWMLGQFETKSSYLHVLAYIRLCAWELQSPESYLDTDWVLVESGHKLQLVSPLIVGQPSPSRSLHTPYQHVQVENRRT